MSIYIGNLSYEVTQDDLKQVFADYGAVKSVVIPIDRETGNEPNQKQTTVPIATQRGAIGLGIPDITGKAGSRHD